MALLKSAIPNSRTSIKLLLF